MSRQRIFHLPAIRCEDGFFDEGPHSGCAEFEPGRWYPCHQPATHIAKFPFAAAYQGDVDTTKVRFCRFHAKAAVEYSHGRVRIYRFRKVAPRGEHDR